MGNIPKNQVICKCLNELHLNMNRFPISDRYYKKLSTRAAIMLFVEGEIQQRKTLEDIRLHLLANEELQQLTGISSIHSSTLNRKLEKMPLIYLQALFEKLANRLMHLKRGGKGVQKLGKLAPIDSTSLTLPFVFGDWAFYQDRTKGVKMHTRLLCLDDETPFPDRIVLSTVGVSDQMAVDQLITRKDLTYILDRGYVNYKRFTTWVKDGVLFVARLKASNSYSVVKEHPIPEGTHILRDAEVTVHDKKSKTHTPLRLVEFEDEKRRIYKVVTTRRDISAADVSEIYRCRWQIELFFKWIKQHLTTVTFHNYHPNAVWAQLYISVISYLLCQLLHAQTPNKLSLFNFVRHLRLYSRHKWKCFVNELKKPKMRTSKGRQKSENTQVLPRGTPGIGKNSRPVVKIIIS
ncbi:IS4 family transposase [Paenibacillus chondroitinus]